MNLDFAKLLEQIDATEFAGDPRPGWSGPALLFGASGGAADGSGNADVVVAGIPFDGSASSRPGAAEGPAAIRRASLVFSSYLDSLGEHAMLDMRTGRPFRYRKRRIIDAGDLHIYPTDMLKTFRAVASETRELASRGDLLVLMGGDHSISFPTFAGWSAARLRRSPGARLGYVQIDNHFDFGTMSAIHGALYHGSNARRISELPAMAPERMAFIGQGAVTRAAQLEHLQAAGYHVVPALDIHRQGAAKALAPVAAAFRQRCDAVYLSIDIDVLDCSVAPGTGSVTLGGLDGGQLLDVLEMLAAIPVQAIDITEVAPRYDPSGRTAQIAAQLLFDFIHRDKAG